MLDIVKKLSEKIDESQHDLKTLDDYWNGEQPAAFLSPEARTALGNRLRGLAVNFPRLAVTSLTERLQVTGFLADGADNADEGLWRIWRRNGMQDASVQAHTDALVYGRSFVMVWAGQDGAPRISVESPRNTAVIHDPATRQVIAGLKRWAVAGTGHAVLYLPDRIVKYTSKANITDSVFPTTAWSHAETIPNPLGVPPIVPLVNRGRLHQLDGVSEMSDILDLADALNKLTSDMMVTSEFFARPRRWVTGLELVEDDDGNVVNPFSDEAGKLWQSEAPETKFGQFDPAQLDGYTDAAALLTQQIGALSGLPPHYLGLNGDQPPSADSIRSAESSLASRCYTLQRTFGMAWSDVIKLVVAVRDGSDPLALDYDTIWSSPETRTPAQAADAAVKLSQIGVPLPVILADTLGMSPQQVERVRDAGRAQALDNAGVDLEGLLQ
ncbi:phage portal protein [Brevibacterium sp. R8603A2]|uniref:phage portal protein n=1 Tax=Brevibacterium sp. R8603A2 TaxID=2929779 RepID=UPI001FFA6CC1|nr:phage portal protein [Brevibacterium sp. R8603A2]MCK1804072.1 phage portal protein [Brevibacterium sp. R8603A2]